MAAIVSVREVCFSYARGGGGGGALALDRVSLEVEEGVIVGVIGPNGGGKTTLLRLMLGEITPDSGEVRVGGMEPRKAVARGDVIGYLPQMSGGGGAGNGGGGGGAVGGGLPLTVMQAVCLGLAGKAGMFREYAGEDVAFARRMVERVGLGALAEKPIQALSGGELQRVYVARALAPRPRLLLLDEPTTGIDRGHQQRLIELVAELRRELGVAVVLVSHDLRAVTSVCDRIACLDSTLHYHDVPRAFPAELARGMFCCDLEAMGIGHGEGCEGSGTGVRLGAARGGMGGGAGGEWLADGATFGRVR